MEELNNFFIQLDQSCDAIKLVGNIILYIFRNRKFTENKSLEQKLQFSVPTVAIIEILT